MTKHGKPRAGSLGYWPRKRAVRIYPNITIYPASDKAKVQSFAAYKAGMTHAIVQDVNKNSPSFGEEIAVPVTVLDCPSLKILAVRTYKQTSKGYKASSEQWIKDVPKNLARKTNVKPKEGKIDDGASKVRLIVCTQPQLAGTGKKKPEIFEMDVAGKEVKENIEFAKSLLGKEISVNEVFKEGELVDVIAITKGKGTAGPVKRFGIKIQNRKANQKRRHVGGISQQSPGRVRRTVAQAGQMGFQRRTELNKRILKIGEGKEVTPAGGFTRYGVVKSNFMLIEGSVPGSQKRLVMLRAPIRPMRMKVTAPQVKEIVK